MAISKKTKWGLIITAIILSVIIAFFAIINLVYYLLGRQEQVGKSVGYEWSASQEFSLDSAKVRTFNMGNKDFKVLLIADVQRKNGGTAVKFIGTNHILDWVSEIELSQLIKQVNPDLMLMLGDNVANKNNDLELKAFSKFFDKFKIAWAPIFGNHDAEGRANKAKLTDIFKESEYCIFEYGPHDLHGAGNYIINLNRGDNIEYSLYMMDSGMYTTANDESGNTISVYDGINAKQIEWYNWATDGINALANKQVKNMAFMHIPIKEYTEIQPSDIIDGKLNEKPSASYYDYGFFNAFTAKSGTHIFVGHDHLNNSIANYKDVVLGYALKSSYNSYFKGSETGGTLLTFKTDGTVTISLERF